MSPYILDTTPGGLPTLAYRNGREVRIHSAYDPAREAERAVAAFSTGRATMIAVSGIGLGYHLAALSRAFPGMPIVAVEHDPEVVDLARKACPRHLDG
jgi:predicted methyltransferase